jgi:hypothetical protein
MRKSRVRKPRGPSARRTGAEIICYEYTMFMAACDIHARLPAAPSTPGTEALRNITLEAALLHARNLRDFFGTARHKDDIVASDFVRPVPRLALPTLRSVTVRRRFNRLLAHASYNRSKIGRCWNLDALHHEITGAWARFLERLAERSPECRGLFAAHGC